MIDENDGIATTAFLEISNRIVHLATDGIQ